MQQVPGLAHCVQSEKYHKGTLTVAVQITYQSHWHGHYNLRSHSLSVSEVLCLSLTILTAVSLHCYSFNNQFFSTPVFPTHTSAWPTKNYLWPDWNRNGEKTAKTAPACSLSTLSAVFDISEVLHQSSAEGHCALNTLPELLFHNNAAICIGKYPVWLLCQLWLCGFQIYNYVTVMTKSTGIKQVGSFAHAAAAVCHKRYKSVF